jgi:nitrate reductase gamma subunit
MYPEYASVAAYSFAGNILANILESIGLGLINYKLWVWVHALISMIFLAYIPFSKAWHIFVSPLEIVIDASERA